jgi:CDP-diacylglycerol--glycerol-3-phosphate 3-phosphatidyltransferase
MEVDFYNAITQGKKESSLLLKEYIKPQWTFHGKGLWYVPPGDQKPAITLIGSGNLGERSISRDIEAQLMLLTEDETVKEKLDKVTFLR